MLSCKDGARLPNALARTPSDTSLAPSRILAAFPLTATPTNALPMNAIPTNEPGSFRAYYRIPGGARPVSEDQLITAILYDETPLTRESLSTSLNLCGRGVRVLTAASLAELESAVRSDGAPDVALANFNGRTLSNPELLPKLRDLLAILGGKPLIILADSDETGTALEAIRLGAHGYISTTVSLTMALEAIRLVAAGGIFVPATIMHRLILGQEPAPVQAAPVQALYGGAVPPTTSRPHLAQLTPRQIAVLECLQEGKPNKVIAHDLGVRESTVKVHVRNILRRLGATNRTEAVCRVMRDEE